MGSGSSTKKVAVPLSNDSKNINENLPIIIKSPAAIAVNENIAENGIFKSLDPTESRSQQVAPLVILTETAALESGPILQINILARECVDNAVGNFIAVAADLPKSAEDQPEAVVTILQQLDSESVASPTTWHQHPYIPAPAVNFYLGDCKGSDGGSDADSDCNSLPGMLAMTAEVEPDPDLSDFEDELRRPEVT